MKRPTASNNFMNHEQKIIGDDDESQRTVAGLHTNTVLPSKAGGDAVSRKQFRVQPLGCGFHGASKPQTKV